MDKIAVVLNTPAPLADIAEKRILCADGGYKRVVGAEKEIFVIGDFDSLGQEPTDVPHLTCPVDKDYTDGERAVRYALETGEKDIVIYGADGGRMDMQAANLSLLKIAYDGGANCRIETPTERVYYTEKDFSYTGEKNKRVSVLPFGGEATFRSSTGLRYSLAGIKLTPSDTVGLSNRTTENEFSVSVAVGGALLFIEK